MLTTSQVCLTRWGASLLAIASHTAILAVWVLVPLYSLGLSPFGQIFNTRNILYKESISCWNVFWESLVFNLLVLYKTAFRIKCFDLLREINFFYFGLIITWNGLLWLFEIYPKLLQWFLNGTVHIHWARVWFPPSFSSPGTPVFLSCISGLLYL